MSAPTLLVATGLLSVVIAPGCSSGGGGGAGNGAETCPAGYDAGAQAGGTEAVSENGQCGNLLTGTKANGQACQEDSDCAPTCCACPSGSHAAQVALCSAGACVVGVTVCCAWIASAAELPDGGSPFECQP